MVNFYLIQAQKIVVYIDLPFYFWLNDVSYKNEPTFHSITYYLYISYFLLCKTLYYSDMIGHFRNTLIYALIFKCMKHFKITIKLTLFYHDIYNQLMSNIFRFFKSQHDQVVMVGIFCVFNYALSNLNSGLLIPFISFIYHEI